MADYIDWAGTNGRYRYWFMDTPSDASSIKKEPGNYMFVKPTDNGWLPVYIGIAEDLSNRIPNHDRWADAVRAGATHVMSHTNIRPSAAARQAEEQDLIAYWQPPLNIQHRQVPTGLGGLGFLGRK